MRAITVQAYDEAEFDTPPHAAVPRTRPYVVFSTRRSGSGLPTTLAKVLDQLVPGARAPIALPVSVRPADARSEELVARFREGLRPR